MFNKTNCGLWQMESNVHCGEEVSIFILNQKWGSSFSNIPVSLSYQIVVESIWSEQDQTAFQ